MADKSESVDVNMKGETTASPSGAPSTELSEKNTPIIEKMDASATNGNSHLEEDDDLSPPPDNVETPERATDERASEDEIVVNSNRNGGDKSSPFRVVSDQEDNTVEIADEEIYRPGTSSYPKRKRHSLMSDLNDERLEDSPPGVEIINPKYRLASARRTAAGFKHAILGFWRDSPVPDEVNKHAVVGFIDVRDRLRTRIQTTTRTYDNINNAIYPVPPGPGGSWVTFERVVFEPHLVGLNHHHVKEYVKLRAGAEGESVEEKEMNDLAAVKHARQHVIDHPPPETAPQPVVAYGNVIPEDAVICSRSEIAKRRKLGSGVGTINAGGPIMQQHKPQLSQQHVPSSKPSPLGQELDRGLKVDPVPVFDPLFGTRPTRVVIGFWKPSDAPTEADRHAVLGILGMNDMFRAKVVRETRDGRFYDGNFPNGAGALWIQWNEIVLEPHLRGLNRSEVKEYVRVRQYQLDRYIEKDQSEKINNETQAVYIAQQRVTHGVKVPAQPMTNGGPHIEEDVEDPDFNESIESRAAELKPSASVPDLRGAYIRPELPPARHPLPSNGTERQSSRTPIAARRDFDVHAGREIERLTHQETRRAHFAAQHDAMNMTSHAMHAESPAPRPMPEAAPHHTFADRVGRLDSIWHMQEQQRNRSSSDETKFFGGIKYERKVGGPWAGKLVSQGTIISIDGEDYVEYRVLTKPQFF